jgi:hypothetical protein
VPVFTLLHTLLLNVHTANLCYRQLLASRLGNFGDGSNTSTTSTTSAAAAAAATVQLNNSNDNNNRRQAKYHCVTPFSS